AAVARGADPAVGAEAGGDRLPVAAQDFGRGVARAVVDGDQLQFDVLGQGAVDGLPDRGLGVVAGDDGADGGHGSDGGQGGFAVHAARLFHPPYEGQGGALDGQPADQG